ncbi:hypothetical protein BDV40DRAFT_283210 [Aspergillus tamarii]|uniref:HotDog domain-containing protein n=1 Tax=Aspergillus tamarii TaxID=41984 RepID=A0A5N6UAN3_ASPTM|nr:hypothetical protein BDV40DRAFT_283210 [Aspergillus tamarii]
MQPKMIAETTRTMTQVLSPMVRGYRQQTQLCHASVVGSGVKETHHGCLPAAPVAPTQELLNTLLHGYRPTFRRHPLGWEADALLELGARQQMCYYDGKLFGGYLTLLLDRILADCCQPAVTAYLHTSFVHSVPPDVPIRLRAWPEKVDRRKIYLVGSIQIPGSTAGEMVEAIRAHALFVRPRH